MVADYYHALDEDGGGGLLFAFEDCRGPLSEHLRDSVRLSLGQDSYRTRWDGPPILWAWEGPDEEVTLGEVVAFEAVGDPDAAEE